MKISDYYTNDKIINLAKALFSEERSKKRLDGWFLISEYSRKFEKKYFSLPLELRTAKVLYEVLSVLPLSISKNAIFAGTQADAFAKSYALINPTFKVESFAGYCDPLAVYNDIEPNAEFTKERISVVKDESAKGNYAKELSKVYSQVENDTREVAYFIEQVTGHVIPDFRYALKYGIKKIISELHESIAKAESEEQKNNYEAFITVLNGAVLLANRYADIAKAQNMPFLEHALRRVPENGCDTFFEAIQAFLILWQVMCIEQAPNPFAFSVGNADRIFEPYRQKVNLDRDTAAALLRHFLVFFNVGDRSWAISQNIIIGGRLNDGEDLTCETSYALLDAYYDMNLPQPILSVKLHKNTPDKLYEELGRFFFTPGCLTPSLFNDDALFEVLEKHGIAKEDLQDYSVAGCQEPLIMGKDNGNTTNSWLNLAKILELTLTGGFSLITGEKIGCARDISDINERLNNLEELFLENVEYFAKKMSFAANGASLALSNLRVPFLSTFMGAKQSGYDMRDPNHQGTKYNASGCLIHGLSVVADSIMAVKVMLKEHPEYSEILLNALKNNYKNEEGLLEYLKSLPKFGNNNKAVDEIAVSICKKVANIVRSQKNYLGNSFRPDFSTPSTHLLYGYWVGATPDGRTAREMLNYGVDPLYGDAVCGMGFRTLSSLKLPYAEMNGGYASHLGIDPKYFTGEKYSEKGKDFHHRIIEPLFFNSLNKNISPFYLYVNVTTPDILRKVLADPKKYAPSGVYIMRIHGTFVNFLDLSPAIQEDIIKRLDLKSTSIA